MIAELTELEQLLLYLETTSLEPHDDYTSEFTYKDQKTLWKYIKELQQENKQLKENNMSMQEEMVRTWKKVDLYKEVIEEVRRVLRCNNIEVLKYHDEPSETTSYELVTVDILQILDKVKEMSNE